MISTAVTVVVDVIENAFTAPDASISTAVVLPATSRLPAKLAPPPVNTTIFVVPATEKLMLPSATGIIASDVPLAKPPEIPPPPPPSAQTKLPKPSVLIV